ncbi:MAG TPA: hypothetical protein VFW83_06900 [Bryobacteraceae bacterium]|nr:hypothetical protein [Bryobacteraceae bacterium]
MSRAGWLIAAVLFARASHSAGLPAPDRLAAEGFDHFYNLEYDQALADFQKEASVYPDSPEAFNHIAQTVIFRALYKAGALDTGFVADSNPFFHRPPMPMSAADRKLVEDSLARSMDLSGARLKRNPKDIGALYAMGVAHGLRADDAFLIKKAWIEALREVTAERKLHAKVLEIDPGIADARLIEGLHDYIVGSLVFPWKMIGFVAGFHGNKQTGIQTLKLVAEQAKENRVDAAIILEAILRREHRPAEALPFITNLAGRYPRNFLFRLERVQLYGDMGDKTKALAEISAIERLKRTDAPGYDKLSEAKIHFVRGSLLFRFGDLDQALEELKLADGSGGIDHRSSAVAWLHTGQIYDLKRQRQPADAAYREAMRAFPHSDISSQAKHYISSGYTR